MESDDSYLHQTTLVVLMQEAFRALRTSNTLLFEEEQEDMVLLSIHQDVSQPVVHVGAVADKESESASKSQDHQDYVDSAVFVLLEMQILVLQSLVIVLPLVALADLDFHLPPWPTTTRHLAFEVN